MNFKLTNNSAVLNVLILNFTSARINIDFTRPIVEKIAKPILPLLPTGKYLLYVRDIKEYSIDNLYPSGHTFNRFESMIAVPHWDCDITELEAVIAHEMHHLARWQYVGYGRNLGEAAISEGLATLYEEEITGKKPAWAKTKIDKKMADAFIKEWGNSYYDHNDWFYNGKFGRWVGYSIGYRLAKQLFPNGIDLVRSLKYTAKIDDFDSARILDSRHT